METRIAELGSRNFRTPRSEFRAGFTLIELLLVLVILSVLAAIVVPKLTGVSERSRITAAKAEITSISGALSRFEIDIGRYPRTEEGLKALVELPAGVTEDKWTGPYIERGVPKDPWGNPYVYECPGRHNPKGFDLSSAGPDGQDGTADDIANWSEENK
jgi:general secretion pathway protein G